MLFDVDGVLVDSLPQHLAFCRDLAQRWALPGVTVPDEAGFRAMVDAGVKVSPMRAMFQAFGFPAERLAEAVHAYDHGFMATHAPKAFAGLEDLLERLKPLGLPLGLVTANVQANVRPVLGAHMAAFVPALCHFLDSGAAPRSKAEGLALALATLGCLPSQVLYVGDQPADAAVAAQAGLRFLAVRYGWGFASEPGPVHAASRIQEIAQRVREHRFSA